MNIKESQEIISEIGMKEIARYDCLINNESKKQDWCVYDWQSVIVDVKRGTEDECRKWISRRAVSAQMKWLANNIYEVLDENGAALVASKPHNIFNLLAGDKIT